MRSARIALALALAPCAAAAACATAVDGAPTVHRQRVATDEDRSLAFVLDGSDPDGDALGWAATQPAHGTLVLAGAIATYTPAPDFAGTDTVEVVASDGQRSARAVVVIDVAPVPDAPRVRPDTFPAVEDEPLYLADQGLLANDVDPDGDRLQVVAVKPIIGGSIELGDDEVVFTPTRDYYGAARFAYTVSDGTHRVDSEVILRVGGRNDAPVLTGDVAFTDEDVALALTPPELLRNDVDPDGDSLVITEVDDPIGGQVELFEDGTIRFTPAPDFHGDGGFLYRAGDGRDESEAWVTVVVGAIDDVPVAGPLAVAALEDAAFAIPTGILTERATDGDGDPLLVVAADHALQGSVVLLGDRVRFVPAPDATGAAGFHYRLSDGVHESDGWVDVSLFPVDDPPVALDQAIALGTDDRATFALRGRDVDSLVLEPELIELPVHGALLSAADGQVIYTPEPGFVGDDELRFVIHADGLTSAPARIVFVVGPSAESSFIPGRG